MKELAYYFLHDLRKFQEKFQRVLDRTPKPKEKESTKVGFWIEFFRSMALSIQNTQLGKELEINHVCFSIGKVPNSKTQILKLAFKINDKVILRSISIGGKNGIPTRTQYSQKEINVIKSHLFGSTADTTIDLEEADSKVLHINIKDDNIQLSDNNVEADKGSSGTGAENIKLVHPLQLGQVQQGQAKTLDTMLDLISNPASASEENIEAFFSKLIELYNTNEKSDSSTHLEAGAHGFTYGLFTLIYKHKYALDTYVEQSAGKGFLDIEVIFRRMMNVDNQKIENTHAGSRIIGEFKRGEGPDTSAQAAIKQIKNRGYNYNLYGRTDSESLIAVGLNFNRNDNSERVKVDLSLRPQSTESFISKIVELYQSIDKTNVENLLENIYHSIRSDEPLHLVILGNLLSQDNISNKKVFTINEKELNKSSNTKVTIFSFKHDNEHIILTITDTDQKIDALYKKGTQIQELGSRRSQTQAQAQSQTHDSIKTTIQKELENVVIQIQQKEIIHSGKRINLTINSENTKKFNDDDKSKSYLQDITIQDIRDYTGIYLRTSTGYTTYDCNRNIDAKELLLALIHSNPPNSPHHQYINTLVTFKELLFAIKDLIAGHTEAGFKSLMHGLYLTQFKPEASSGHGRVDGIIRYDNDDEIIPLEFKFNGKDITAAAKQGQGYIKHLKSVTNAKTIKGIALNFNKEARSKDDIITYRPFEGLVDHHTSDEGGNSPIKAKTTGEDTHVEETLSEVELSKTTGGNSGLKRQISNLGDVKSKAQNVGLKKVKGSDGAGASCSGVQRQKRNVASCINEEASDDFLYEPLEEDKAATKEQIKEAKIYAQVAMMLSLHSNMGGANAALDNMLTYNRNVGEIINEGAQNHSARELKLLQDYYRAAHDFLARYHNLNADDSLNNQLLQEYTSKVDHQNSWLVDNGSHSLLVISDENRYKLYSPDFNYRYLFQTKEGTTFSEVMALARVFFKWRSNSTRNKIYTLSTDNNLLQEAAEFLKEHPIWANPDQFLSDQVLLSRDHHNAIDGISVQTIRALFSIDDQPVDITMLNSDFFQDYGYKTRFRVEALHKILPFLTEQESIALAAILKRYHIYADTSYLDKLSTDERPILEDYNNQVMRDLKEKDHITSERLSEISWNTIGKELEKHQDISSTHKEQILETSKLIHESAFKNIWIKGKGVATQALFFLPDMIRAANGNADSLVQNVEILAADTAFNQLYTKLISGLESVGSVGAASILSKLPVTSPIFKFVVIHSVVELHQQLATLPYDSQERGIIKHQLTEQYATLGLMVAELFGIETGPLWVALMMEQVMYGGEAFRKLHHLHIDLGEAILMSLGFEQDKFEDIMEDRRLVSRNLAMMNSTENALNMQFGWKIVKVPVLGRTEWNRVYATKEDTTIKFAPYYSTSCNEVNIFQSEASEKDFHHKLVQSVEDNKYCEEESSSGFLGLNSGAPRGLSPKLKYVNIQGGLAAVYVNTNNPLDNIAQRTMYVMFDPREGNLELYLDDLGWVIDTLNRQYRPAPSLSNNDKYIFITYVTHKPYPSSIIFPENANNKLSLQASSNTILKYYIDVTVPFQIQDKSFITQLVFLPPISHNTSSTIHNMYIKSPSSARYEISYTKYSKMIVNGQNVERVASISDSSIVLKGNREYLQLVLGNMLIDHTLELSAKSVKASGVQGKSRSSQVTLSQDVEAFNLTIVGNIIIHNHRTSLRFLADNKEIKFVSHYSGQLYTDTFLYKLQVGDIYPVLDGIIKLGHLYKFNIAKDILCHFRADQNLDNILKIESYQDNKYSLVLQSDSASLKVVDSNNQLTKIEVKHYFPKGSLDDGLILKNNGNFNVSNNSSLFNFNEYQEAGASLIFQSDQEYEVLHHFPYKDSITINNIDYTIREEQIYVMAKEGEINANKLIKYMQPNGNNAIIVPIFINALLKDTNISVTEDKLHINNATFQNLPDNVQVHFKKIKQSFSIKELKDILSSQLKLGDSDHHRNRREVDVDSEPVTSSAIRYTSFISDSIKWFKDCLIEGSSKLFSSTTTSNNLDSIKFHNIGNMDIDTSIINPLSSDTSSVNIRVRDLDLDSPDIGPPLKKPTLPNRTKRSLNCVKNCADESSINVKNGSALTGDSLSYITPGVSLSKIFYKEASGVSVQSEHFNGVSSGSNRLEFWPTSLIKKAGKTVLSILSSNWLSSSKEKVHEDLPASNLLQSEPLVEQQPLVKVAEASNTLLEAHVDPSAHQRPPFNASPTGPTLLEMGDQWVQSTDMPGLLTWGILLARKWTGYRPKAAKSPSYNLETDIKLSIQSHELVDAFMDKVLDHAQACGLEKPVSNLIDNSKLYIQAVQIARKKLASGQLETVVQTLFTQIVQNNINKIVEKSAPDQVNELLASIREDLAKIQQQFLKQEVSLESQSSEAVLANTTSKADINLLKQEMCSMQPIDQLAGTTWLIDHTYNMKDTLVQNSLDHGSPYTECVGL